MEESFMDSLTAFEQHLIADEKSRATVEKYLRDVRAFLVWGAERELNRELLRQYKEQLTCQYAPASVNSMLASVNCWLRFIGREDCKVKQLRIQRQIFAREDKELTKAEYRQLVLAAKDNRISLVIQTICGTGIRVSELPFITAEAVQAGKAVVSCKNKTRVIFIPAPVRKLLRAYMKKTGVTTGSVFVTRSGKPLDRSNIWKAMKALCLKAGIAAGKVFPHNLRHLFARTFYSIEKDIVHLADLLGHSSINTTRIYTMDSGAQHIHSMEKVMATLTT
jgi:site-specific recombinase XerD